MSSTDTNNTITKTLNVTVNTKSSEPDHSLSAITLQNGYTLTTLFYLSNTSLI